MVAIVLAQNCDSRPLSFRQNDERLLSRWFTRDDFASTNPQWFAAASNPSQYATCMRDNSTSVFTSYCIQYIVLVIVLVLYFIYLHIYILMYMTCIYRVYICIHESKICTDMLELQKEIRFNLHGGHFNFQYWRMDWPFVRRKTATCWSWGLGSCGWKNISMWLLNDLVLGVWFM